MHNSRIHKLIAVCFTIYEGRSKCS